MPLDLQCRLEENKVGRCFFVEKEENKKDMELSRWPEVLEQVTRGKARSGQVWDVPTGVYYLLRNSKQLFEHLSRCQDSQPRVVDEGRPAKKAKTT